MPNAPVISLLSKHKYALWRVAFFKMAKQRSYTPPQDHLTFEEAADFHAARAQLIKTIENVGVTPGAGSVAVVGPGRKWTLSQARDAMSNIRSVVSSVDTLLNTYEARYNDEVKKAKHRTVTQPVENILQDWLRRFIRRRLVPWVGTTYQNVPSRLVTYLLNRVVESRQYEDVVKTAVKLLTGVFKKQSLIDHHMLNMDRVLISHITNYMLGVRIYQEQRRARTLSQRYRDRVHHYTVNPRTGEIDGCVIGTEALQAHYAAHPRTQYIPSYQRECWFCQARTAHAEPTRGVWVDEVAPMQDLQEMQNILRSQSPVSPEDPDAGT